MGQKDATLAALTDVIICANRRNLRTTIAAFGFIEVAESS